MEDGLGAVEMVQMVPDDDEEIEDDWLETDSQNQGDDSAIARQILQQARPTIASLAMPAHQCCPNAVSRLRVPRLHDLRTCVHDLVLVAQVRPFNCKTDAGLGSSPIW